MIVVYQLYIISKKLLRSLLSLVQEIWVRISPFKLTPKIYFFSLTSLCQKRFKSNLFNHRDAEKPVRWAGFPT